MVTKQNHDNDSRTTFSSLVCVFEMIEYGMERNEFDVSLHSIMNLQ